MRDFRALAPVGENVIFLMMTGLDWFRFKAEKIVTLQKVFCSKKILKILFFIDC